jgi:predicted RNase H-like nuclease (RuvC/YqgF family)
MPQVNLKKQAVKRIRPYDEMCAHYENKLLNLRADLYEEKRRASAYIATLEAEAREKEVAIAETTAVAVRRSARIAALRREIDDKNAHIAQLNVTISHLEVQLSQSRPMPACRRCRRTGHNSTTCTR